MDKKEAIDTIKRLKFNAPTRLRSPADDVIAWLENSDVEPKPRKGELKLGD